MQDLYHQQYDSDDDSKLQNCSHPQNQTPEKHVNIMLGYCLLRPTGEFVLGLLNPRLRPEDIWAKAKAGAAPEFAKAKPSLKAPAPDLEMANAI